MFIINSVLERVHQPPGNYSFIHHLMAVLIFKMLSLHNLYAAIGVCYTEGIMNSTCSEFLIHHPKKVTMSAPNLSISNRYAIPPEHGKRLERLATGKRAIYILFVSSIQVEVVIK